MFVARLVICVLLFCLPFLLPILASRKPEAGLMLMFPLFGAIPAAISALILFVPVENWLDRHDLAHLKNIAVPAAGSIIVVGFMLVVGLLKRKPFWFVGRIREKGLAMIVPVLIWSLLGTVWGGLWRLSDWMLGASGA